ncbi:MAG: hypothetical protein WCL44_11230 [bacterium]
MKKLLSLVAAMGLLSFVGCGGKDSSPVTPEATYSFDETFVPFQSAGGFRLGDTYATLVADHGEPVRTWPPTADSDGNLCSQAWYGDRDFTVFLADADGDGQLSNNDTVKTIFARANVKWNGVGTGSTRAEIVSVFGNPVGQSSDRALMMYINSTAYTVFFIGTSNVVEEVDIGLIWN